MMKRNLVGKIFGIALVFVMIGGLLGTPIYANGGWANPPQLVEPGAIIEITPGWSDTLTPTFEWDEVPEADYYGLYIRDLLKDEIVFNSEDDYGQIYGNKVNHHLSFKLPDEYKLDYSIYQWNMASHSSAGWSYERNDGGEKYSDRLYFTTYVKGTDVSANQGQIDWDKVPDDYKFAFCRATIGETEDDELARNVENASKKMLVGVYHAAWPDNLEKDATVDEVKGDAKAEAEYFLSIAQKYIKPGYLRPILDVERIGELNETQLTTWVDEWIRIVKNKSTVEPILYTYPSFANKNLNDSVSKYDLWIAHFVCSPGATCPPDPVTWNGKPNLAETPWKDKGWSFWQYADIENKYNTNKVHIPGIEVWNRVDLDVFNGNLADLQEYRIGGGHVDVALIIDDSGSMSWNDPFYMRRQAANIFVDAMQDNDQIGIVAFNSFPRTLWNIQPIVSDRTPIKNSLNSLWSSGGTSLSAGLLAAYGQLLSVESSGNKKAAVFLTDGVGSYNNEAQMFANKGWPIYVLGLGYSLNEPLLQKIAADSGGLYQHLDGASQLQYVYYEIAQQIAGGTPILSDMVHLAQAESWQTSVNVPLNQLSASFLASWTGSTVDMSLVSPNGTCIGPDTTDPDVYHAKGLTYELYRITNPEAGEWTITLYGSDLPSEGESVSVQAAVLGPTGPPADTTPPLITISSPTNGATYFDNLPIRFDFSAEDPESGIDTLSGTLDGNTSVSPEDEVGITDLGLHTFTVEAVNGEGLTTTENISFTVNHFAWLPPIKYLNGTTETEPYNATIKSTIPIKFAVFDSDGNFTTDTSVRVVVEGTTAQFVYGEGDTNVRINADEPEPLYIVNLHTNFRKWDYNMTADNEYWIDVLFDNILAGRAKLLLETPQGRR